MNLVCLVYTVSFDKTVSKYMPIHNSFFKSTLLLIIVVLLLILKELRVLLKLWILPWENLFDQRLIHWKVLEWWQKVVAHSRHERQKSSEKNEQISKCWSYVGLRSNFGTLNKLVINKAFVTDLILPYQCFDWKIRVASCVSVKL